MRLALLTLLAWLLASQGVAKTPECPALEGVHQLWAKPQTRFLIFGEYHGTVETPELFADAVCHALAGGRTVRVGVELPQTEQPAIDRFMTFRTATYEPSGPVFHDGRHSKAMLELLGHLRERRASGLPLEVFGFAPATSRSGSLTPYEHDMASHWVGQARDAPGALIMILVGNLHALKRPPKDLDVLPAAAFLPPESAISLVTNKPGGAIWACVGEGCGPTPWPARDGPLGRGVYLGADEGYDGRFSVGGPFAPSPPFASDRPAD